MLIWQSKGLISTLLVPLSWAYRFVCLLRKQLLTVFAKSSAAPIIVVGNISVGGNGKTPVLIALAQALQAAGYRVGIVSRGYKSKSNHYPLICLANSDPRQCGDEPVMIASQTQLPVVVDPKRSRAVRYLQQHHDVNVILSDDGLQHYAMARALEIAVIGTKESLGNGRLLPAGPLREPVSRLKTVNWVISQADTQVSSHYDFEVCFEGIYHLQTDEAAQLASLASKPSLVAVSGIAHPQRFFSMLTKLGLTYQKRPFADHHQFCQNDFSDIMNLPIIMTEKDAIKCRQLALKNGYYVKIKTKLNPEFIDKVINQLQRWAND